MEVTAFWEKELRYLFRPANDSNALAFYSVKNIIFLEFITKIYYAKFNFS
jgi:hypothetical protein